MPSNCFGATEKNKGKSGRGDEVGFFQSIESLNNFKTFVTKILSLHIFKIRSRSDESASTFLVP